MVKCTVCGRTNLGGSKFCEQCGAEICETQDSAFNQIMQNPSLIRFPHPPSTVTTPHPLASTKIQLVGRITIGDECEITLDGKDEFLIGRADKMAGIIPDVDLSDIDKDMTTSRRHSKITKKGDAYTIEDLGSTNFTYLNGRMLSPKTPTKLDDGDVIRIGKVYLVFSRVRK